MVLPLSLFPVLPLSLFPVLPLSLFPVLPVLPVLPVAGVAGVAGVAVTAWRWGYAATIATGTTSSEVVAVLWQGICIIRIL